MTTGPMSRPTLSAHSSGSLGYNLPSLREGRLSSMAFVREKHFCWLGKLCSVVQFLTDGFCLVLPSLVGFVLWINQIRLRIIISYIYST